MALGKFPHEIDEMPAADFYEFMLYDQMEPFGGARGDLHAGIIASLIANVHRDPKKHGAFSPADFMPFREKPKAAPMTSEGFYNMLQMLSAPTGPTN